jgi:hypothetical protein
MLHEYLIRAKVDGRWQNVDFRDARLRVEQLPDWAKILMQVEQGLKTVRQASVELDWDMEKVQEVLWGEVRL